MIYSLCGYDSACIDRTLQSSALRTYKHFTAFCGLSNPRKFVLVSRWITWSCVQPIWYRVNPKLWQHSRPWTEVFLQGIIWFPREFCAFAFSHQILHNNAEKYNLILNQYEMSSQRFILRKSMDEYPICVQKLLNKCL